MSTADEFSVPDEETTLLLHRDVPSKRTPLPMFQILVLLSVLLTETITFSSIPPYINEMMSELPIVGGDQRKVGYYTGITLSVYYLAEAVTVFQWNRLSDFVGRKPILLAGLLGTTVSITLFGLSRSFWTLVFCRCLGGALNGNVGVAKTVVAELTDDTNVARGFSLLLISGGVGQIIGSFIGGFLSRPQDHWPNYFPQPFWAEYPYFLPCLVVASFSLMQFAIAAIFFEETLDRRPSTTGRSDSQTEERVERPPPLRSLLTRPVVISIANQAVLVFLNIAASTLMPLVWSTPIVFGGLGLAPASIGLCMSVYGCISAISLFVLFPRIVTHFGPRRVIVAATAAMGVIYVLYPFENMLARGTATVAVVWPLVVLQLLSLSVCDMGFSSIFMYISSSPPNKRSLGAANGLAQTVDAIQCAVGPVATASLFAFSLQNNVLGGQFAYAVLLSIVCVGLCLAAQLPGDTWKHQDRSLEAAALEE
ncbi:MFS general substrate transporter [Lactarius sanguifluus]|nr:MFS general substrate transporter [Lactarius sanguifluus]